MFKTFLKHSTHSDQLPVPLGPWFAAELTEGHIGFMFVHGLYLKGRWIPEPTCYAYGFFQVRTLL